MTYLTRHPRWRLQSHPSRQSRHRPRRADHGGGGYTYFNPQTGHEFSAVAGFTYNFKNQDTQYQNGIDFHIDWGASQFLSKQLFVGLVGYAYQQITDDSGAHPILDGFRSRVIGVGPQIGFLFPVGDMQGYLNLKGYGEFDQANRPAGWNTWLTFSISPMAPTSMWRERAGRSKGDDPSWPRLARRARVVRFCIVARSYRG